MIQDNIDDTAVLFCRAIHNQALGMFQRFYKNWSTDLAIVFLKGGNPQENATCSVASYNPEKMENIKIF